MPVYGAKEEKGKIKSFIKNNEKHSEEKQPEKQNLQELHKGETDDTVLQYLDFIN